MLGRDELEAELGGFLLHVFDLLFLVLRLVLFNADCFVFHFVFEHPIDYPRNHVRGGDGGLCFVQPAAQPSIKRAEHTVRAFH